MKITRRSMCVVYGLIGVLALIGTWGNNLQYLHFGVVGGNVQFWRETLANPASRSITVDILFLSLAVTIWMLFEARRLAMRGVWLYVFFAVVVAVSFTFPIFMINRERALSAQEGSSPAGVLKPMDILGLCLLSIAFVAYTVVALIQ